MASRDNRVSNQRQGQPDVSVILCVDMNHTYDDPIVLAYYTRGERYRLMTLEALAGTWAAGKTSTQADLSPSWIFRDREAAYIVIVRYGHTYP